MPVTANKKRELRRRCGIYFRVIVKHRDHYRCYMCGRAGHDVAHVIRRSADRRLAVDPSNGIVLCRDDHRKWHDDEGLAHAMFAEQSPEVWEYLQEQFRENRSRGTIYAFEYAEILEWLQDIASDMGILVE